VVRLPDLAVLRISQNLNVQPSSPLGSGAGYGKFLLVLRDLDGSISRREKYYGLCRELIGALGVENVILAIQSVGRGNDDAAFYQRMNFGPSVQPIEDALKSNPAAVVVSVRLHGALQSIISGFPTVHLSYERKGFGAYEDLGIKDLVHNAFDFDVKLVSTQAIELMRDRTSFWLSIAKNRAALQAARGRLIGLMRGEVSHG
jgi:hypothetical protein